MGSTLCCDEFSTALQTSTIRTNHYPLPSWNLSPIASIDPVAWITIIIAYQTTGLQTGTNQRIGEKFARSLGQVIYFTSSNYRPLGALVTCLLVDFKVKGGDYAETWSGSNVIDDEIQVAN